MKNKKANFGVLQGMAIGVGIFSITTAIVLTVQSKLATTTGLSTEAQAGINTSITETANMYNYLGIIIIAGIGLVLFGLISGFQNIAR